MNKRILMILATLLLAACSANTQSGGTLPTATPASMDDVAHMAPTANPKQGTRFENGVIIILQDDGSEKSIPVLEDPAQHIGETVLVFTTDNSESVPTMGVETIPSGASVTIMNVTATTILVVYNTDTYTLPANPVVFIPAQ